MTTKDDLIRKFLGKAPDKATSLELHTIGGIPGSSPIATWPAGEVSSDVEAARVAVLEAAQEHCDVEAETCLLQMMWCRGSSGLAARRIRAQPSPDAAAAAAKDTDVTLVKELLRANMEQNKMILHSIGAIVAGCKDTLTAATEQTRVLTERLQNYTPAEVVDSSDRDLKRQALSLITTEGPPLLNAVANAIMAHAEGKLAGVAHAAQHLNGAGHGSTPTQ
jgi:hypothetical protein